MIHNAFEMDFNRHLKEIDLTVSQLEVIRYLSHTRKKEVSQKDIEQELKLKNPTITGILKRLEEKGFIQIEVNKKDKRRHNIVITQKAIEHEKNARKRHEKMEVILKQGMTEEEVAELERMLNLVIKNLEQRNGGIH